MNEVDKRVVQMEFDNKKFEQNVSETIKSLQKLDEALKINSSTDVLDKTGKSANKLDKELSNVNDTLVDTRDHFSAIEVIGVTALATLTNSAVKAGAKIARSFNKPLSLAISGGISRSQNIENAKFMLRGLGVAWADIYEDIDYGVKNTAYGLDAAAKVASQLVASGVSLGDNMKNVLRGISGVAAMTNSTYEEIGSIFTTVAGQGKLMTMQLRQLEARGLNVAAQLGKVQGEFFGKTEAEIRQLVSDGKIGFQAFADAMNEAFGEHAVEANKTFSGALSNTRAALSRLGEAFATPTFEMFRKVLVATIPIINKIKDVMFPLIGNYEFATKALSDYITKFLESQEVAEALEKGAYAFYTWLAAIRAALDIVGIRLPDLIGGAKSLSAFFTKLTLQGEKAHTVVDIFATFFQTIKLIHAVVKSLLKIATPFLNLAAAILGKIFGVSGNFFEILYQVEGKLIAILDIVSSILALGIGKFLSLLINLINRIDLNYIFKGLKLILAVVITLTSALINLAKVIFTIVGAIIVDIPHALSNILGIFGSLRGGADAIADVIRDVFGKKKKTTLVVDTSGLESASDIKKADNEVKNINRDLGETGKKVNSVEKNVSRASKTVSSLNKVTKDAGNTASKSLGEVSKSLDTVNKQVGNIKADTESLDINEELAPSGESDSAPSAFEKFFDKIKNVLSTGVKIVGKMIVGVRAFLLTALSFLLETVKMVWDRLISFIQSLNWVEIALIALGAIIAYTVYNILSAVNGVISTLAALGNLAKGYADRAAAAKFTAMTGMILAFGAVCATLMLVIDHIDINKLSAGIDAILKLVVKIGAMVIVFTILQTIMSVFKSISTIMLMISRLTNVTRNQLIVAPLQKLFETISQILFVIFASVVAFQLLFGGEDGWKKFWSALVKVGIVLLGTMAALGGFAWIMWATSKMMYDFTTTTSETRSLLKKTAIKTTTDPLESMASFFKAILPYFAMLFKNVIIFALLNKYAGKENVENATYEVMGLFVIASAMMAAITLAIGLLQDTMKKGKSDVTADKWLAMASYMQSLSNIIKEFGNIFNSLFRALLILTIINALPGGGKFIGIAFAEIVGLLLLTVGFVATLFHMANKYKDKLNGGGINDITGLVESVVKLINSLVMSLSTLAFVSKFAGGSNFAAAIGSLMAISIMALTFVAIIANNLSSIPDTQKFASNVYNFNRLISEGIIKLIGAIMLLISAVAISLRVSGMNAWYEVAAFSAGISIIIAALTASIHTIMKDSKDLTHSQVDKVKNVIRIISGFLTVLTGDLVVISIAMAVLNRVSPKKGIANLAAVFATLTSLLSIVSLAMVVLVKNHERFDQSTISKIRSILIDILLVTTAFVGLMAAIGVLFIVMNSTKISGASIAATIGTLIVTIGLLAGIFALLTKMKIYDFQAETIRNTATVLAISVASLAAITAVVFVLADIARRLNGIDPSGTFLLFAAVVASTIALTVGIVKMASGLSATADWKNLMKVSLVMAAVIGFLTALTSLVDVIGVTANVLDEVNKASLFSITGVIVVLGLVFSLITYVSKEAKIHSIIVATLCFIALIGFFAVFATSMKNMSSALEELDGVKPSSFVKLAGIMGIYLAVFGIIDFLTRIPEQYVAITFATAVVSALGVFFAVLASGIYDIALAAEISEDVDADSLYDLVSKVIFDILPILTVEALRNAQNFTQFVRYLTDAINSMDRIRSAHKGGDISFMMEKLQSIADHMPEIVAAFQSADAYTVGAISRIGRGLADLVSALSDSKSLSKSDMLPTVGTNIKLFLEKISGVSDSSALDKLPEQLNDFGAALKGLAVTAVIASAALFVASLAFNAAIASFSVGPMVVIGILALLITALTGNEGPLGEFNTFVGGIMSGCDGILGSLGRLLEGTADWGDKWKLLWAGLATATLLNIGKITKFISAFKAGEAYINPTMAGIAGGAALGVVGYVGASALGEQIGKWISADKYGSDVFDRMEAIGEDSPAALRMIEEVHGDLSKLNNDELKFALDAFTEEYDNGIVQEGEDRETMISLIEAISNQLEENGVEDAVPWQVLEHDVAELMSRKGDVDGVVHTDKYTEEELESIAHMYEVMMRDRDMGVDEYVKTREQYNAILAAIENGAYYAYNPGSATAEYYQNYDSAKYDIEELREAIGNPNNTEEDIKAILSQLDDWELDSYIMQLEGSTDGILTLLEYEYNRRHADDQKVQNEEKNARANSGKKQKEILDAVNNLKNAYETPKESSKEAPKRTGAASGGGLGYFADIGIGVKSLNFAGVSNSISNGFSKEISKVANNIKAMPGVEDVTSAIGSIFDGIDISSLSSIGGEALQYVWSLIREVGDLLGISLPDNLEDAWAAIRDSVREALGEGGDDIISQFDSLIGTLSDMSATGGSITGDAFGDNLIKTLAPHIVDAWEQAIKAWASGFSTMLVQMDKVYSVFSSQEEADAAGLGLGYKKWLALSAQSTAYDEAARDIRAMKAEFASTGTISDSWSDVDKKFYEKYKNVLWGNNEQTDLDDGPAGDLASDISRSSGPNSGINDRSKSLSGSNGGDVTNIDSNNVTYNYVQNNYSPEALSRIDIYRQTNNQLKTVFDALKG